jgi:hypothetical protein
MASPPHSLNAPDPILPKLEGNPESAQRDAEASTFADRAWRYVGLPDAIVRAEEAFRRDLPSLLKTHAGCWVAYGGDERLSIGTSPTELENECLERGLERGRSLGGVPGEFWANWRRV